MKISLVTAYYNRRKYFINTLESIKKTKYDNFEVIAVDDASNDENRIDDLPIKYPFLKVYRIDPSDKKHVNPCVPFNIGFSKSEGDVIILQNPECYHVNDIISYVAENIKENEYLIFSCYSLSEDKTNMLFDNPEIVKTWEYNNRSASVDGDDAWYNHSIYRPVGYHFTSAISKIKLDELGGFDERYSNGLGYDDNEFLHRVRKICETKMIDSHLVLHQYHYNSIKTPIDSAEKLLENNRNLYVNHTLNENKIKVNN